MAGKHSKSIFDIKLKDFKFKNPLDVVRQTPKKSLPFIITASFLVVALIVSSCFVGRFFISGNKQKNILAESAHLFESVGGNKAITTLWPKNNDIAGWINIADTNICYAVCQGDDDSYYINHNQYGRKSRYGALFLSCTDSFKRIGGDKNIVIFGNNIKDGSMFGNLDKYRNINFYKQHPCIELYYDDTAEKYIVFSVMLISSHQDDDSSLYKPYKSFFADKAEFDAWIKETLERSIISSPIEVQHGDEMLTLVTSANDFENARLVVVAKKVNDWDAAHTDVSSATISKKTKYPKIWYTTRGQEYPY